MGLRFILYIGFLTVGIIIGYKEVSHKKLLKRLSRLQLMALIGLLFVMGIRLGNDSQVMEQLGTIGLQAVLLAFSTIVFSILAVWIYRKIVKRDKTGSKVSRKPSNTLSKQVEGGHQ